MPDTFTPTREEIEEILDFDVVLSKFESQAEQRRLRGQRALLGFRVRCSVATKTEMQAYRAYFVARFGSYEAFPFISPFDDVAYTVRFVDRSWRNVFARGVFRVEFELQVVY